MVDADAIEPDSEDEITPAVVQPGNNHAPAPPIETQPIAQVPAQELPGQHINELGGGGTQGLAGIQQPLLTVPFIDLDADDNADFQQPLPHPAHRRRQQQPRPRVIRIESDPDEDDPEWLAQQGIRIGVVPPRRERIQRKREPTKFFAPPAPEPATKVVDEKASPLRGNIGLTDFDYRIHPRFQIDHRRNTYRTNFEPSAQNKWIRSKSFLKRNLLNPNLHKARMATLLSFYKYFTSPRPEKLYRHTTLPWIPSPVERLLHRGRKRTSMDMPAGTGESVTSKKHKTIEIVVVSDDEKNECATDAAAPVEVSDGSATKRTENYKDSDSEHKAPADSESK